MEFITVLRRSFFFLSGILLAFLLAMFAGVEGSWLGQIVHSWVMDAPFPGFVFFGRLYQDAPWYVDFTQFLVTMSGWSLYVIAASFLLDNREADKRYKQAAIFLLIFSPVLMVIVALILAAILGVLAIAFVIWAASALIFAVLKKVTAEKMATTSLFAMGGVGYSLITQIAQKEISAFWLVAGFFFFGMLGTCVEYLWTSAWWQQDVNKIIRNLNMEIDSWLRRKRRRYPM